MAIRTPLILNQITARIEELAASDMLPGSVIGGLMGKNRLINGKMDFYQRGSAGTITASGAYTLDRWQCFSGGAGATSNWGVGTHAAGEVPEAKTFLGFNVVSGASNAFVRQNIEDVRTLANGKATLSFFMRSNVAGKKVGLVVQQVFGNGGSATVDIVGPVLTLDTTFKKYSATFDIPSIVGKNIADDSWLSVMFYFAHPNRFGNQLLDQVGLFELSSVQFEAGEVATPFDVRPPALELVLCQRYFQKSLPVSVGPAPGAMAGLHAPAVSWATTAARVYQQFRVDMRVAPSVTIYRGSDATSGSNNGICLFNSGSWTNSSTAASVSGTRTTGFQVDASSTFTMTLGSTYLAGFHWVADAEL